MRAVKKIEIARRGGGGGDGSCNCIQLRNPEMEDRLLRRQQKGVKAVKRVKGIERYKQMHSDTVDISS
jgi:hypothetical protein